MPAAQAPEEKAQPIKPVDPTSSLTLCLHCTCGFCLSRGKRTIWLKEIYIFCPNGSRRAVVGSAGRPGNEASHRPRAVGHRASHPGLWLSLRTVRAPCPPSSSKRLASPTV